VKIGDHVNTPDGPGVVTGIDKRKTMPPYGGRVQKDTFVAVMLEETRRLRWYTPAELLKVEA
jgi:hypothetical protein